MKLAIERSELQRGLNRIQAIVEKRNSMPILANALLTADDTKQSLELAATDLEVGIRGIHAAHVEEGGAVTVAARKLFDIVKELPDEPVKLHATQGAYLEVRCGRARFSLAGTDAQEYPDLPDFSPEKRVQLQAAVLGQMIERTLYAASVDETRYNLNGVYFEVLSDVEKIRMVATDGHRLALVDRAAGSEITSLASDLIIPRKGLAEIKRLVDEEDADEIELGFEGNSGLVRKGGVTLVMRLIEGEFPNYTQVIPKSSEIVLAVPTEPFVRALRRVVLLSAERSRAVKFSLDSGRIVVSSSNPDLGEASEELDVDYDGEAVSIGFNARYLLDALAALGAKEVRLGLRDSNSPVELRPAEEEGSLAVVMPMRL